jgi:hypothetical protein
MKYDIGLEDYEGLDVDVERIIFLVQTKQLLLLLSHSGYSEPVAQCRGT